MPYLYKHIRLDTNKPFYIGVGGLRTFDNYKRAYCKKGRNLYWKNIVASTEYTVDILYIDLTIEEVFKKEIELIANYGRVDIGTGILCNKTNGGEPINNIIKSDDFFEKIGVKISGKNNLKSKKCYKYDLDFKLLAEYDSFNMAAKENNVFKQNILIAYKKYLKIGGFYWTDKLTTKEEFIQILSKLEEKREITKKGRNILQINKDTGEIIKIYNMITLAQKELSNSKSEAIKRCLYGYTKTAYGFKWAYA
jgi:hypothetical protein